IRKKNRKSKDTHESYLLVESLDRVSRQSPYDAAETMREIVREGVTVVDLLDREREYSEDKLRADPSLYEIMVSTFVRAHNESKLKGERISESWEAKRTNARIRPMTKMGPSWLQMKDGKWQPIEARAKVIRQIFDWAESGVGIPTITKWLNSTQKG